ncbi:MAG TPA: NADP-dependent oxidoreductase, partial [Acidimicrobiales bacterium]|nr:NADP-dependent oxidoreductase [Acidimicrobiales bacterium]
QGGTTMRAVTLAEYGGPQVLSVSDVAEPVAGPGQVRIRTAAATVNPVDTSMRAGRAAGAIPDATFPMILGWDVAGVVDAVGDGVEKYKVGDRVVGMSLWFLTRTGTYAEQVVLDQGAVAEAPKGIEDSAAATIPLNGLTAWSALAVARVEPGDALLVTGAAGGVGGYLVELASRRGVEVVGLGRPEDLDTIRSFGAHRAIDDIAKAGAVAVAVDTTGRADLALGALAPGGRLITIAGKPTEERGDVTVKAVGVRPDADALGQLSMLAAGGDLTMRVADVLPFAEAAQAHRRFEAGGVRGRLVLQP